jgi:DNA-binding NtrC family response regulator
MASILVIEDETILARNVCDALSFAGHDALSARTGEEGLDLAFKTPPDIILLDYRLPVMDGLEVLRELRAHGAGASVIMMTAHGNIDTAVEAMRIGAVDFMTKPVDLKALQLAVERVLEHRRLAGQLSYFRDRERAESTCDQIIGGSEPIQRVKALINRLVSTPALSAAEPPSILITGETGTGKDLVARAIHYAGPRRDKQFVQLNCTALPDHLVEAELFGHVKGAFTDARSDKQGLLEFAEGGSVFLDEIGHMPPAMQAKLLQTIEHRTIRPVGGSKERRIDVHFIAATNRDLDVAIESGDFREDLLHRLKTLTIHLGPLRERGDDVEILANHFLRIYAAKFSIPITRFADNAIDAMRRYDWPGNVRELAHMIESAVLIADGPAIRLEHLNLKPQPTESGAFDLNVAGAKTLSIDFNKNCPPLEEIEYQIIQAALEFSKHNLSRAARILGISRDAIRYRVERFQNKK